MSKGLQFWNGSAFANGTPKVWNGSAFAAPAGAYIWDGTQFVKVWPSQVQYLSKGVGKGQHFTASGTMSWTQTVEADADCLVVLANCGVDGSITTNACVVASGPAFTQVDAGTPYVSGAATYGVFGWVLLKPPTGALTFNYSINSSSTNKYLWANSYSFKGVNSYSAATRVGTTSSQTTRALNIASTVVGEMALAAFTDDSSSTTAPTNTTANSTTLDLGPFVSGTSYRKTHIAAPGNGGTVAFTGTGPSSPWGGVGFRLIP